MKIGSERFRNIRSGSLAGSTAQDNAVGGPSEFRRAWSAPLWRASHQDELLTLGALWRAMPQTSSREAREVIAGVVHGRATQLGSQWLGNLFIYDYDYGSLIELLRIVTH